MSWSFLCYLTGFFFILFSGGAGAAGEYQELRRILPHFTEKQIIPQSVEMALNPQGSGIQPGTGYFPIKQKMPQGIVLKKQTRDRNTNERAAVRKKQEIVLWVEKGMSLQQVARRLQQAGLIKWPLYFKWRAWVRGASTRLKAGEYVFSQGDSVTQILNILISGKTRLHKITLPEGYNLFEMAQALEDRGFLKKKEFIDYCHNPSLIQRLLGETHIHSLEGYLFPDTYLLPRSIKPRQLIRQMVKKFLSVYARFATGTLTDAGRGHFSRHQLVTLASIVEKETGAGRERPLIASVFYNRLKRGMRLESDPTILYGMLRQMGGTVMPLNIRRKDILTRTPYNTYKIKGFPKGPIANPGALALQAVFQPAQSDYLYFVSKNDGTHLFSRSYKAHQRAVNYYQKSLIPSRHKVHINK